MDEPPEEEPPQDEQTTLASELAAARAENEMLLQQITRLCVYIEQTTGVDPIEVMHGRVEPPPVPVDRILILHGHLPREASSSAGKVLDSQIKTPPVFIEEP